MNLRIFTLVLISSSLLTACGPTYAAPSRIHEKTAIHEVKQAKAGTVIFKDTEITAHEGMKLTSKARVKRIPLIHPRLSINKGEVLRNTMETKKYSYFSTDKTYQKIDEMIGQVILNSMGIHADRATQGFKKNKKTGELSGFVINGFGEFNYKLPKDIQWEPTHVTSAHKKAHAETITFVGIDNGLMVFEHKAFKQRRKGLTSKADDTYKKVMLPRNTKSVTLGEHVIKILKVGKNSISYRIES